MNKNIFNTTSTTSTFNRSHIQTILLTVVIMAIFWSLAFFLKDIMIYGVKKRDRKEIQKENMTKKKTQNTSLMYQQFGTILYYFIIFIGITIVLPMYGIHSITMFAIVGTVGLSLCLSSQNLLNNFWAGVVILFNDIYNIDDIVTFSHNENKNFVRGKVKEFNLFYTKMANENGEEVSVSNSNLYTGGVVTNESIVYDS